MGRFVNSGNSAFQVALNSEIYVDKTGLLAYTNKVMDISAKFICNNRLRRFGKSITSDMLTAYYCKGCSSEKMFSSLEIGQTPDFTKYLNQYDVIHLDIQWCMEPAGGPENVASYTENILPIIYTKKEKQEWEALVSYPIPTLCLFLSSFVLLPEVSRYFQSLYICP